MKDKITCQEKQFAGENLLMKFPKSVFEDWISVVNVAIALAPFVEGSIEISCNTN